VSQFRGSLHKLWRFAQFGSIFLREAPNLFLSFPSV
jgi:hypothetical protein